MELRAGRVARMFGSVPDPGDVAPPASPSVRFPLTLSPKAVNPSAPRPRRVAPPSSRYCPSPSAGSHLPSQPQPTSCFRGSPSSHTPLRSPAPRHSGRGFASVGWVSTTPRAEVYHFPRHSLRKRSFTHLPPTPRSKHLPGTQGEQHRPQRSSAAPQPLQPITRPK